MKYAIAMEINKKEEYMREASGDDCFSDDIGNAILFNSADEIKPRKREYIVEVDDTDGIGVIGKLGTSQVVKTLDAYYSGGGNP